MKVVYIADIGIEGGATKSLVELVTTMKERYHVEPVVLTSRPTNLNELLTAASVENYSVGHGAFLQGAPDSLWKKPIKWILYGAYYNTHIKSSLKNSLNVLDWNSVDLIHTNVARDDLGMMISEKTGVPNICHIREFAELDFNCWSYRRNYVKYLAEHTDGFIAISEAVKKYWIHKGVPEDKISVIYNGVNRTKIQQAEHDSWTTAPVIKMVIVGGVISNKGQWQAIEALCQLPENIKKNVYLDVIGGITRSYQKKLEKPLQEHNMMDHVRFLGACSDVYERLKDYHIGLMCSKAEGFGRVTVEYMHAGLAVIASNSGANPELIQNNKNGLLYDRDDISTLTDAIRRLYEDRKLLITTAESGFISAQNYTKELNAERIYHYYNSIIGSDGVAGKAK